MAVSTKFNNLVDSSTPEAHTLKILSLVASSASDGIMDLGRIGLSELLLLNNPAHLLHSYTLTRYCGGKVMSKYDNLLPLPHSSRAPLICSMLSNITWFVKQSQVVESKSSGYRETF
jgi:hypothetical protein